MRVLARIVPPGLEGTAQALYGPVGVGAASAVLTLVSGALYVRRYDPRVAEPRSM